MPKRNTLSRVGREIIKAIRVELNSNSNTFNYSGSLTALLPDGEDPNDVTFYWEQVSGTPVTYTSPLDGQTITFTTTDLLRKEFRVCTNLGALEERCAYAAFLHFPLESIDYKPSTAFLNVKQTNGVNINDILPAYKQNGLISVDPSSSVYSTTSYGDLRTTTDNFTTIRTAGNLTDDVKDSVTDSELWEKVNGSWNLVVSYPEYITDFNLVTITDNTYKIVYKYNLRGLSSELVLPVLDNPYKGFSDRLTNTISEPFLSITNYTNSLQTITKTNPNDSLINSKGEAFVSISNYLNLLQTQTSLGTNNNLTNSKAYPYMTITNYSQSLQTSTGAT